MTRQEAIERFQQMKKILSIPNSDAARTIEAIDMAIEALQQQTCDNCKFNEETDGMNCYECLKGMSDNFEALEQEPSEDLISRKETLKGYQSVCKDIACHECRAKEVDGSCRLESYINNLPSAEPKRGKWLDDNNSFNSFYANCSECGYQMDKHAERGYHNYCPNCGARMETEQ